MDQVQDPRAHFSKSSLSVLQNLSKRAKEFGDVTRTIGLFEGYEVTVGSIPSRAEREAFDQAHSEMPNGSQLSVLSRVRELILSHAIRKVNGEDLGTVVLVEGRKDPMPINEFLANEIAQWPSIIVRKLYRAYLEAKDMCQQAMIHGKASTDLKPSKDVADPGDLSEVVGDQLDVMEEVEDIQQQAAEEPNVLDETEAASVKEEQSDQ
jgi:hypothetical protein